MIFIENIIRTLDEQLERYEPSKQHIISVGSALALFGICWMLFTAEAMDELSLIREDNIRLESKTVQSSPQAYEAKILQTNKAIALEEDQLTKLQTEKQNLLELMSQSDGLMFDNRQYSAVLDQLLKRSVQLGIKIELMQSEEKNKKFFGKVEQFKQLSIKGSGSFQSIVEYLAFIENQKGLIHIQNVQIRSNEAKPQFEAVISFMGVAL